MARVRGALNVTSNYEVTVKKPLDARTLVKSYEDLFLIDNWYKKDTTQLITYNGLVVAVANTADTTHNGLYFLFDPTVTGTRAPDPSVESNWIQIGGLSDAEDFADRLDEIADQLSKLDARLTALEEDSDVETFAYRAGFPAEGELNKLYVAVDEQKSYVWINNDYLPVGGSSYEAPEIIFGGSAD